MYVYQRNFVFILRVIIKLNSIKFVRRQLLINPTKDKETMVFVTTILEGTSEKKPTYTVIKFLG